MAQLYDMTVAGAEDRIRNREVTCVALAQIPPGPYRTPGSRPRSLGDHRPRGRAQRRPAAGQRARVHRPQGPPPWDPHRSKGHLLHRRNEDHGMLEDIRRFRAGLRRHLRLPSEGRRRDRPGQGGDHRVCVCRSVSHPEPLECGPHPGRLQQRLIGGGGYPYVPRRAGLSDRRLPPAGPHPTMASWASSRPMAGSADMG